MFEFPRFAQILPGVVAFRIHGGAQQSLFELSRDIEADRRGRVQGEFRDRNVAPAELMGKVNPT